MPLHFLWSYKHCIFGFRFCYLQGKHWTLFLKLVFFNKKIFFKSKCKSFHKTSNSTVVSFRLRKKLRQCMIATQKLKRSTAVSFIQDSKCKEMREWIFLANSSVHNMENTVVLQQIICLGRKGVSLKFDFNVLKQNETSKNIKNETFRSVCKCQSSGILIVRHTNIWTLKFIYCHIVAKSLFIL